jgi:hypothetical protein
VIALNMLDLSLPVPDAESAGGDFVVSMHSMVFSNDDSHVAPAMVTEVFTSALASLEVPAHLLRDAGQVWTDRGRSQDRGAVWFRSGNGPEDQEPFRGRKRRRMTKGSAARRAKNRG